jgi:hypothetical protein
VSRQLLAAGHWKRRKQRAHSRRHGLSACACAGPVVCCVLTSGCAICVPAGRHDGGVAPEAAQQQQPRRPRHLPGVLKDAGVDGSGPMMHAWERGCSWPA